MEAAFSASEAAANANGSDHKGFLHRLPAGQFKAEGFFGVALSGFDRRYLDAIEGSLDRGLLEFVLLFSDNLLVGFESHKLGTDLRQRAQNSHVGVVVLVHPEAGEALGAFDDGQVVGHFLYVHVLDQFLRFLNRGYKYSGTLFGQLVDGLEPVPSPGLDALAQRVVDDDRYVHSLWLVLGKCLLEFFGIVSDHSEILRRNSISFRGVAVPAERRAYFVLLAGSQHDGPANVPRQILLKYASVNNFDSCNCHAHLLKMYETCCVDTYL